jgi:lysophospholipase L1-like esterase/pimeloyl-ACP methyl ester carboxylesterase
MLRNLILGCVVAISQAHAMSQDAWTVQDVAFTARVDNSEQRYVLAIPGGRDSQRPHDLLIALHGHGSDRWQFVKDERGECRGLRELAAQHQMIFVSPDYRAKTSWMGPLAEADVLQILDDLHGRFRIRNVIIAGGSMGGTAALTFAALHPKCVDGVVSLNGTANLVDYPNFADAISESFGGSREQQPDVYRQRSAEFFPDRLKMPVAVTTGGMDSLVPPDSVLRLVQSLEGLRSPVHSIHRQNGGHSTTLEDTQAALQFVIDQLDHKSAEHKSLQSAFTDQPVKVLCLGDSVTGVYYHTGGLRAYPEMLEIALRTARPNTPVKVINAGISGNTTTDGLNRLDRDVLQHKPQIVTISFGLNDMTRVPEDQFRANLQTLIDRCRTVGSHVVLCTPNAVIDTADRPIVRLESFCDIIRDVAQQNEILVCDQYAAGRRLQQRAPRTWRLTMSDAIHPNMDGHKRMAEELCRCLTGEDVSVDESQPPRPHLPKIRTLLESGQPVRLLVVDSLADVVTQAIRKSYPEANLELHVWPMHEQSLVQAEEHARQAARAMKPNLVVLTFPEPKSESEEQQIHSISWIMNWSLSFGVQEWDCVAVEPAVLRGQKNPSFDDLVSRLVHAQHLPVIDGHAVGDDLNQKVTGWFQRQLQHQNQE